MTVELTRGFWEYVNSDDRADCMEKILQGVVRE
jgi:hypothetical protein